MGDGRICSKNLRAYIFKDDVSKTSIISRSDTSGQYFYRNIGNQNKFPPKKSHNKSLSGSGPRKDPDSAKPVSGFSNMFSSVPVFCKLDPKN